MSKRGKIIVINLGWEQEPLLDRLNEYDDLEIYGIHYDENYYNKPRYKEILIKDVRDLESMLRFAEKIKPDAVISDQCDYSYFAQSLIAEKYNLPGPRIKEAQIATNKYLQRQRSKEYGINIPDFEICESVDKVYQFANKVGFPIITKPIDNRGSFGVNRIDSKNEIKDFYNDALVNSFSRLVLAEKFIEGVHITVDGYIFQGIGCKSLTLATKILVGTKRQVAIDILYPGELNESVKKKAMNYNEFVNNKLGFKFGMTHSEYMVTRDEKVYLIETANRGGGVYTSEIIVPNVCGIDIVSQYVHDVINNNKLFYKNIIEANQVLLKFFSFKPGRIKQINGLEKILTDKSVLKFRLAVDKGDEILPITTDANRHGFFILKYEGNIKEKCNEIVNKLEVIYE